MIGAAASPKTFNPLFASDSASDGIIRLLNGSLVNLNPLTQEPVPGLAEAWQTVPPTFGRMPGGFDAAWLMIYWLGAIACSHDTFGFMSAKVPVGLPFQAQTCSS